ncbi:hypothetical protein O5J82_12300 [Corynebacterium glutamicum]|nr:hypothetical protein [Corynebacterium glutamicum]NII98888.1 hypothetical protein [Corynebacterium glutamicum]WBG74120.1 hypothetical protein O5J82_12300 [Corynebacterium glutamicum]
MSKPEGNLGGALSTTDRLNKGFARCRDPLEAENVYWEYRNNGVWIRINTDNNFQVTTADGLTSLTVTDTAVDQSGARLCAVATNASGPTMSREAVLTVRSATEIPDDGLSIDDVVLRWGISEEVQSRPLFGDSNYLSAGVSDGSALTYESTDRDVRIIHRVLLQSWARVEKPNLKTLVVLAPGCLSCLEYPADDHRVWVRVPVRSNIVP